MIDFFNTLQNFFKQFTEHVFLDVLVDDPDGALFPRITYNFSSCDWGVQTLINFQVWSRSLNMNELYSIANKIEKSIGFNGSELLKVSSTDGYEFFNMLTEEWQSLELDEFSKWFNWHIDNGFNAEEFQWRIKNEQTIGALQISRASPFMQSRATDERNVLALYGVINAYVFLI